MCKCCEQKLQQNFPDSKVDLTLLDPVFKEYEGQSGSIIGILQKTQDIYGYLPLEALTRIAEKTGDKKAKIYGIATFYAQFRLEPLGKYVILLCQGTACHVNGSEEVGAAILDELKLSAPGTSEDGLFTVEDVACLGCCSLAPVMMINGEAYGKLTPDKARRVIKDIYKKEKEGACQ